MTDSTFMDVESLKASWVKLSEERWATVCKMRDHGKNSLARERLQGLDALLCAKLHAVGESLRAEGVDPRTLS